VFYGITQSLYVLLTETYTTRYKLLKFMFIYFLDFCIVFSYPLP